MKRLALLIDLESILGFDSLPALVFNGVGHAEAREELTSQVEKICEIFAKENWQVIVVDSHQSGSGQSNILPRFQEQGGELYFPEEDAFGALFDGSLPKIDALAAWGMHAGAMHAPNGFAAHSFALHTTFGTVTRQNFEKLNQIHEKDFQGWSEAEILLALCEAHYVPVLFVAGAAALLDKIKNIPFICTQFEDTQKNTARPDEKEVYDAVKTAAKTNGCIPKGFSEHHFVMRFKNRWMNFTDGQKLLRLSSQIKDAYVEGQKATDAALCVLNPVLGSNEKTFASFALALLKRPFAKLDVEQPSFSTNTLKQAAQKSLLAFLKLTDITADKSLFNLQRLTLRALVLQILECNAKAFFDEQNLQEPYTDAHQNLYRWPLEFIDNDKNEILLDGDDVVAIADLFFLCEKASQPRQMPLQLKKQLRLALQHIEQEGDPLTPWLVHDLLHRAQVGFALRSAMPFLEDPCFQVYVDSHLIFLEKEYGIQQKSSEVQDNSTKKTPPFNKVLFAALERMRCTQPQLEKAHAYDALAELALCTQLLGEKDCPLLQSQIQILLENQQEDGSLQDISYDDQGISDHITGLALLVFALQLSANA